MTLQTIYALNIYLKNSCIDDRRRKVINFLDCFLLFHQLASLATTSWCVDVELTYNPNHAAPAPTNTEISPDCATVGSTNSINQLAD
jgi:hypothetical protein